MYNCCRNTDLINIIPIFEIEIQQYENLKNFQPRPELIEKVKLFRQLLRNNRHKRVCSKYRYGTFFF